MIVFALFFTLMGKSSVLFCFKLSSLKSGVPLLSSGRFSLSLSSSLVDRRDSGFHHWISGCPQVTNMGLPLSSHVAVCIRGDPEMSESYMCMQRRS